MRIELDSVLRHPREVVFAAYRDDISAFVEFLPNVRAIEVLERTREGSLVKLHNLWHGSTELPAALAGTLEARFFSWDDHATWDADTLRCDWTISPRAFRDAVRCTGRCDFVELPSGKTRFEMTGELAIELDGVKGMPHFLAGSLGRTAEAFLVRQLTANFASICDALAAFLQDDTMA